ncbi:MAG: GspE/PulE family protein [Patescibacteria group bacterium]
MDNVSILKFLQAKGLLSQSDAHEIEETLRTKTSSLEELLSGYGLSDEHFVEAKSELLGIPVKKLENRKIPFEILKNVPEESARHYQFVPLNIKEGILEIGMVAPENLEAREALQFISSHLKMPFRIFLISRSDFEGVLKEYGGLGGEVTKALGEIEEETVKEREMIVGPSGEVLLGDQIREEAPISKMVAVILRHAQEGHASDVHIEPGERQLRVRFRVDGVLYTSIILPMKVHESIISRIKVMTNMKIDEKRVPQDGRFRARIGTTTIDFRVSTFPTYFGEKAAIRILDPGVAQRSLEELGMEGRNLELIKKAIDRPYGLILLTGPTGSGKSTTLYAILRMLNDVKRNVVSLEDPVEYFIDGVNQSQVHPEIHYTFASGIRNVLRQDPDVIMVGEIRDKETAQLAIHAALTGHLVFSTLHTNNAIGVIPRLIDMSVDPFLIPATLSLAIAQRLVATLCPASRKEVPIQGILAEEVKESLKGIPSHLRAHVPDTKVIYQALPSPMCPKGIRGRIGIFESLEMTRELETILLTNPSEQAIADEAQRQGMITLRQDGILKVLQGKVGLEELSKVVIS